jgi:hypothetical protein
MRRLEISSARQTAKKLARYWVALDQSLKRITREVAIALRRIERPRVPQVSEGDRRPQTVYVGKEQSRRPGSTGDVLLELLSLQSEIHMELMPHAVGFVEMHFGHPGGSDDSHDRSAGIEHDGCPRSWRNPSSSKLHRLEAVEDGVRKAGTQRQHERAVIAIHDVDRPSS